MQRLRYYFVDYTDHRLSLLPMKFWDWKLHLISPEDAEDRYGISIIEQDDGQPAPSVPAHRLVPRPIAGIERRRQPRDESVRFAVYHFPVGGWTSKGEVIQSILARQRIAIAVFAAICRFALSPDAGMD